MEGDDVCESISEYHDNEQALLPHESQRERGGQCPQIQILKVTTMERDKESHKICFAQFKSGSNSSFGEYRNEAHC